MKRNTITGGAAALAVAAALAGCGGGQPPHPPTAAAVARQIGATAVQPVTGQRELYTRDEVTARYHGQDVTIYTFNNADGERAWKKAAATFGAVIVAEGRLWLVAR